MTTVLEQEKSSSVPQGSNREGLIFEHSKRGRRGYRLPALDVPEQKELLPKEMMRDEIAVEVEVSEVDCIRHFTRLSKLNVSINAGLCPLGSCTLTPRYRLNQMLTRTP